MTGEERVLGYINRNSPEARRQFLRDISDLYEAEKRVNRINPGTTLGERLGCGAPYVHVSVRKYRQQVQP